MVSGWGTWQVRMMHCGLQPARKLKETLATALPAEDPPFPSSVSAPAHPPGAALGTAAFLTRHRPAW